MGLPEAPRGSSRGSQAYLSRYREWGKEQVWTLLTSSLCCPSGRALGGPSPAPDPLPEKSLGEPRPAGLPQPGSAPTDHWPSTFPPLLPSWAQLPRPCSQNGNQENPSCCGIDGILEAYHQSLRTVQLYGPTNFAPVVTHVAR